MLSTDTIHDFLQENKISISLVLFQKSIAIDHLTYSEAEGTNVTDSSVDVSDKSVTTFTDEGERIFEVEFEAKRLYTLFNSTRGTSSEFESVTRTHEIESYSRNPIFYIQTTLLRFLPLVVAEMDPSLYLEHIEGLLNITSVDYLYITSYPTFEGYKITHDPIYTAYFTPQEGPEEPSVGRTIVLMGALLAAFGALIVFLIFQRK